MYLNYERRLDLNKIYEYAVMIKRYIDWYLNICFMCLYTNIYIYYTIKFYKIITHNSLYINYIN